MTLLSLSLSLSLVLSVSLRFLCSPVVNLRSQQQWSRFASLRRIEKKATGKGKQAGSIHDYIITKMIESRVYLFFLSLSRQIRQANIVFLVASQNSPSCNLFDGSPLAACLAAINPHNYDYVVQYLNRAHTENSSHRRRHRFQRG